MNWKMQFVFGTMCVLGGLVTANDAAAGTLPNGSGKVVEQAPAPAAKVSPEDVERAKSALNENACLGCHRVERKGMYMGPSLNGVGTRRTPEQIRQAILAPHPKLDPSNVLVMFTTADGKTVSGRRLSQNDKEIRVISATGEVTAYPKAGLQNMTIIDVNPMPAFDGKIDGEDLDSLIRYLSSLPALDETTQK